MKLRCLGAGMRVAKGNPAASRSPEAKRRKWVCVPLQATGVLSRLFYFLFLGYSLLFGLMASGVRAEAPVTVDHVLRQLGTAMQTHSFRGEFTYQHGSAGATEALEIIHAVIDGVEYERINHLDGPEREFLRLGAKVDCLTPGRHLLRGGTLSTAAGEIISLDRFYSGHLLGSDRVAGRDISVVRIIPRDSFRYGFTLGVDKETGLLVKSLITSTQKIVLERVQFVSLELEEGLSEDDFLTGNNDEKTQVLSSDACAKSRPSRGSPFKPEWLPGGFVLADYSYSEEDGHMETYTDGLASFSLFINDRQDIHLGQPVWRGATVALMSVLTVTESEPLYVTVVGEIPVETARRVSLSIQRAVR